MQRERDRNAGLSPFNQRYASGKWRGGEKEPAAVAGTMDHRN